jgi:hypothetical protein
VRSSQFAARGDQSQKTEGFASWSQPVRNWSPATGMFHIDVSSVGGGIYWRVCGFSSWGE